MCNARAKIFEFSFSQCLRNSPIDGAALLVANFCWRARRASYATAAGETSNKCM